MDFDELHYKPLGRGIDLGITEEDTLEKPTILIIEDRWEILENTAELLELSGYKSLLASNGKEGIEKAIQYMPDLIISDILMPGIDGYVVLEQLSHNEKTSDIPFIFLTALSEKFEKIKGLDLGADDYLVKPFQAEELIRSVRQCLLKKKALDIGYGESLLEKKRYITNRRSEVVNILVKDLSVFKENRI